MKTLSRILTVFFLVAGMGVGTTVKAAESSLTIGQLYEHIRKDPERLRLFLQEFPKGGDLHNQLDGSLYAEKLLNWAVKDNLCISVNMGKILPSPCGVATHNEQPAALLLKDMTGWSHLIAALSLRDFVPTVGDRSAHDHFFGTYDRFSAVERAHQGDMLAGALKEAARNHVSYVEFAITPLVSKKVSVTGRPKLASASDLPHVHEDLLNSLPELTVRVQQEVTDMQGKARKRLHCEEKKENPVCQIEVRYLFQVSRNQSPLVVFTELEMGYLLARNNPLFAGVTLTGPEDAPLALEDYGLQMGMLRFLNGIYKNIKLDLPAGELTNKLVPPGNLSFHIMSAVRDGSAKRISQGLDIGFEQNPETLLRTMAQNDITVAFNLTRNEKVTEISGQNHPFMLYHRAGIPIVLTSDNGGILRSDLTEQYVQAARNYPLHYGDLVHFARSSLEQSFLEGRSLWVSGHIGHRVKPCAAEQVSNKPYKSCAAFLQKNARARLEWQLEVSLKEFASHMTQNIVLTR